MTLEALRGLGRPALLVMIIIMIAPLTIATGMLELDGAKVRTLDDSVNGAHVGRANSGNIGICYVGGVDKWNKAPKDTRTVAQKRALRELVLEYRKANPAIIVRGHRDWPGVAKACPSFDVAAWLAAGMPL